MLWLPVTCRQITTNFWNLHKRMEEIHTGNNNKPVACYSVWKKTKQHGQFLPGIDSRAHDSGSGLTAVQQLPSSQQWVQSESGLALAQNTAAEAEKSGSVHYVLLLFCWSSQATAQPVTIKAACYQIFFCPLFPGTASESYTTSSVTRFQDQGSFPPVFLLIHCFDSDSLPSPSSLTPLRDMSNGKNIPIAAKRLLL